MVEHHEKLSALKGTQPGRLYYVAILADLDVALRKMPPKYREAVVLCGMLGIATRSAGALLDVSGEAMRKRYLRGLEWLHNDLNGGEWANG